MDWTDPEARRRYYHDWNAANREKRREQHIIWRKNNPEKVEGYQKTTRKKRVANGKAKEATHRWEEKNRENVLFRSCKQRAKVHNLPFNIDKSDIVIPDICPLLNIPINRVRNYSGCMQPSSPSVDRIDNKKGYVKGNIRVISWQANRMKHNATKNELLTFAENIKEYLK